MDPELRLLVSFLAVAEELNFTRAAERLHIAQPALSAQVRQLEAQLDVRLLERSTRSVTLTDAGRAVVQHAPAALSAYGQIWTAARQAGRGERGRLRLAYSPSTGYETAPRLVEAMRARYPDVEVDALPVQTPDVITGVLNGTVDVGIARSVTAVEGLRLRLVRVERQGALAHDAHPLSGLEHVTLEQLAEYPILMHERTSNPGHHDFVTALFAGSGLRPKTLMRPVAYDPSQRAIRAGQAVGLVGSSMVDSLPRGLTWTPLADPAGRLEVQLVLRDGDIAPVADRFERVAVARAAESGWLTDAVPRPAPSDGPAATA